MLRSIVIVSIVLCVSCDRAKTIAPQKTNAGVQQAAVTREVVKTDSAGRTAEQRNILRKLKEDNQPGAVKHFYVFSAFSGDCIIYSPVDGKVTSSGKRLTPTSVAAIDGQYVHGSYGGMPVTVGGLAKRTSEVIQDDGTFGHSIAYLFWTDTRGVNHKHYVAGGQIVHIASEPMRLATKPIVDLSVQPSTSHTFSSGDVSK